MDRTLGSESPPPSDKATKREASSSKLNSVVKGEDQTRFFRMFRDYFPELLWEENQFGSCAAFRFVNPTRISQFNAEVEEVGIVNRTRMRELFRTRMRELFRVHFPEFFAEADTPAKPANPTAKSEAKPEAPIESSDCERYPSIHSITMLRTQAEASKDRSGLLRTKALKPSRKY